jgi:hypothetical protein
MLCIFFFEGASRRRTKPCHCNYFFMLSVPLMTRGSYLRFGYALEPFGALAVKLPGYLDDNSVTVHSTPWVNRPGRYDLPSLQGLPL